MDAKNIIDKEMLKHLVNIGSTSTEITKTLKVHQRMVACYIKENELASTSEEPDDDIIATNALKDTLYWCKD